VKANTKSGELRVAPLLEVGYFIVGRHYRPAQIEQYADQCRKLSRLLQLVARHRYQRSKMQAWMCGAHSWRTCGNAVFLIDGMPNRDEVNGGAAAQFNQDSILEFQVVTSSYNAEFGHGSAASSTS